LIDFLLINDRQPAAANPDIRVAVEEGDLFFEPIRRAGVICIHSGNELSFGGIQADIKGSDKTQVIAIVNYPDALIAKGR
jgi:hypothetical protein